MENKTINFYGFLDQDFVHNVNSSETTLNMIEYLSEAFANFYRSDVYAKYSKETKNDFTFFHNDINHLLLNAFRGIVDESFEVQVCGKTADDCSTWPGYNLTCNLLDKVVGDYLIAEQDNECIPDLKIVFAAKKLITSILLGYLDKTIREDLAQLRANSGEAAAAM